MAKLKPVRTFYREVFSVPVMLNGRRIELEVMYDKHSSRKRLSDAEEVRFVLDKKEMIYRCEGDIVYASDALIPEIAGAFRKHLPDYVLKHLPC